MESMTAEPVTTKTKIVIDRSKWRTGGNHLPRLPSERIYQTGKGLSALQNDQGYLCCLGFICKQTVDDPDNRIITSAYPSTLSHRLQQEIPGMTVRKTNAGYPLYANTMLADDAALINDSPTTTPKVKEARLLELFKDSMFELEFVGEYCHAPVPEIRKTK